MLGVEAPMLVHGDRRSMRWIVLISVVGPCLACFGIGGAEESDSETPDTNDTNDTDTHDTTDDVVGPSRVVLSETEDGSALQVTIQGGVSAGWLLGAVYPAMDLYEEGCRDRGDVCHPLAPSGGDLTWCRGETPTEDCTAIAQVYWRIGNETVMLQPTVGVGCWVWGNDADYYADLGCEVADWDPSSF
jgi:hypothetical protein